MTVAASGRLLHCIVSRYTLLVHINVELIKGLRGLDWATVILAITIISIIGPGIDLLTLNRHKSMLHKYFLNAWNTLDDAEIPDLGRSLAIRTSAILSLLIGNRSLPGLAFSAFLIVLFNAVIIFISYFIFFKDNPYSDTRQAFILLYVFWPILLINFPFDYFSILITRWSLQKITSSNIILALFYIVFDLFFAAFFAVLCASSYVFLGIGPEFFENPLEGLNLIYRVIGVTIGTIPFEVRSDDFEYAIGILALTTFLPTVLFLLAIAIAITVKSIVEIIQRIFIYLFEKFTENDSGSIGIFSKLGVSIILMILTIKTISCLGGVLIDLHPVGGLQ